MAIELNSILSYGRNFREHSQPVWWFSMADEKVVDADTLRREFGFQSVEQMRACTFLVPVFQTDIIDEERAFLRVQPRSPKLRRLEALPDEALDRAFRAYIEQARLTYDWRAWEHRALRRDGEKWCREHGIPYR